MAKINAVGNALSGATGTGNFVGANSPLLITPKANSFISLTSTPASGTLNLTAITNIDGNFNTTISNASGVGQNQTVTIPDSGNANPNFILDRVIATQTIYSPLIINSGFLESGANGVGGFVKTFAPTSSSGTLSLQASNNAGNFAVEITNASMGQSSTITIPDPGVVSANFIISESGLAQTIAGGLDVTSGRLTSGQNGTAGEILIFAPTLNSGSLNISAADNAGNFPIAILNKSFAQTTNLMIPDPGLPNADFILSNSLAGQAIGLNLATATPANLALSGSVSSTTSITGGSLAGLYGQLNIKSVSGTTAMAGTVGETLITSASTLTSPSAIIGIKGNVDFNNVTINGARIVPIYGLWGATGTIQTDMSATHGILFENTSTDVLNSQLALFGDAQYALEVAGASTFIGTATVGAPSGPMTTLKVHINGVAYQILAATSFS